MADYRIGATREDTITVGDIHLTTFLGPDGPSVLSTPRMIAHMEGACRNLVLDMLDPGHDSVGTHVNVYHKAAALMGAKVTFWAELTGVTNRRLHFKVKATSGDRIIGDGTHERAVVDVRKFKEHVKA